MVFKHSTLEALPLRKDQKVAVSLSLILGMAIGLLVGYFQRSKLSFNLDTLIIVGFAGVGVYAGSCIGLKTRGIVGWVPLGIMAILAVLGVPPFFPNDIAVFYVSWAASALVLCCYQFKMNGVKKRA